MAKDVQGHDTPGNGDGKEVDLALGSALGATTSSVGTQRSVHKGVRERLTILTAEIREKVVGVFRKCKEALEMRGMNVNLCKAKLLVTVRSDEPECPKLPVPFNLMTLYIFMMVKWRRSKASVTWGTC